MSLTSESREDAGKTQPIALKVATRLAGLVPNIDPSTRTVVFTHVPKTGGMTLDHIMMAAATVAGKRWRRLPMTAQRSMPRHERRQMFLDFEQFPQDELADCDYVTGHMPFGIHRRLPRPSLYIVLLRDPVARLLSNFRFGIDRGKQSLQRAHRRHAQAFVEIDGFGVLLPDYGIVPRKLGIAGKRLVDTPRIARVERAGGVPRQQ